MIRLGSISPDMHEMFIDDVFLARLKLLIIMAKAYLHGYPLGHYRRNAITSNAQIIESEAIDLGDLDTQGQLHFGSVDVSESEKKIYENVRILAKTALDFASGEEIGISKQEELDFVLNTICESITFDGRLKNRQFLEVA